MQCSILFLAGVENGGYVRVNSLKSKAVHFCKRPQKRSDYVFCIGGIVLIIQHPINFLECYSINLLYLRIIQKI